MYLRLCSIKICYCLLISIYATADEINIYKVSSNLQTAARLEKLLTTTNCFDSVFPPTTANLNGPQSYDWFQVSQKVKGTFQTIFTTRIKKNRNDFVPQIVSQYTNTIRVSEKFSIEQYSFGVQRFF